MIRFLLGGILCIASTLISLNCEEVLLNKSSEIRNLRVVFADYKPYIHKKRNAYNGMEYLLVKTIANKLNMSISFESTSRETLSTHWEPLSGYKFCCVQLNIVTFFETKIYFSTDIGIGGIIHQMHNNTNIILSTAYSQDKLIWCIQRAKKIPLYVNFFSLFL